MKGINRILAIGGVCCAFAAGTHVATAGTTVHAPTRQCPEDAAWVGVGDYSHGYWSWYKCIALDDVTAFAKRRHARFYGSFVHIGTAVRAHGSN